MDIQKGSRYRNISSIFDFTMAVKTIDTVLGTPRLIYIDD